MVFIFVLGVGISCCGSSLAWLLGGSGVGARATGGTRRGGGIGGSIGASDVTTLAKSGGGGGGGRTKPPLGGVNGIPGATGTGGGGGGGKGIAELLLAGGDAFRDVPHVWSTPRQWQHRFVCSNIVNVLDVFFICLLILRTVDSAKREEIYFVR